MHTTVNHSSEAQDVGGYEGLFRWITQQWHILFLFIQPLLITLINPNWLYNLDVLNRIDTWIYSGLFRYFFDFADKYPSNAHYFAERLSWVLPGYGVYQIFPPEVANAVMHLSVFYLCIFAIYGVIRRLFNADAAFITAICLGSYTWFLRAAGHDYVDGIGIAYFSIALFFATEAVYRSRFKTYLFLSGVFLGLMILSQLFLMAFLPVIFLYYVILNQNHKRDPLISGITRWAAGSGLCLLLFAGFNALTVGEFNMLNDSLLFAFKGTSADIIREIILRDYAITPATWLVLPCMLMGCAVIIFLRWKKIDASLKFNFRLVVLTFILTLAIFLYFHYRSSYLMLLIYLYMSLIIPVLFIFLGGLIALTRPVLTTRSNALLLLISLSPFIISASFVGLETALLNPMLVWIVTSLLIIALAICLLWRPNPIGMVGAFMLMSLMFSGHNGIAAYDRLRGYRIFEAAEYTLATITTQAPDIHFSDYVVWEDTDIYVPFSETIRGMTQPVHRRLPNWSYVQRNSLELKWVYPFQQDIIFFVEDDDSLDAALSILSPNFLIEVRRTIELPQIDPTGQYRAYLLRFTQRHAYGEDIFPYGDNLSTPANLSNDVLVAWTGPQSNVIFRVNLPSASMDVRIELCGLESHIPIEDELQAMMNQNPIRLTRQAALENCPIRYTGTVSKDALMGDRFDELAINIPVSPQSKRGLAISSITFNEVNP